MTERDEPTPVWTTSAKAKNMRVCSQLLPVMFGGLIKSLSVLAVSVSILASLRIHKRIQLFELPRYSSLSLAFSRESSMSSKLDYVHTKSGYRQGDLEWIHPSHRNTLDQAVMAAEAPRPLILTVTCPPLFGSVLKVSIKKCIFGRTARSNRGHSYFGEMAK